MMLIVLQLLSLSLFNLYGVKGLSKRTKFDQILKINNNALSDTVYIKKDINDAPNLFPNIEKQKYKHDSKYSIYCVELLLLSSYNEKKEFYSQEVEDGNLIPRSPPNNLV
jgi:hypothetical protein